VTLTAAQLKLPEIEEFVVLLVNIASDGVLDYEELQKLTDWLNGHIQSEIPAVRYMVNLMLRVCADGKVTEQELFEIQLAIERILPKQYRTRIAEARQSAYYNGPASAAQLDAIESCTGSRPFGLTRREASEALDRIYNRPSNRQLMVLRFFNRMDLATTTRSQISGWLDSFIEEDPARWEAWELFKAENGDDGSQRDPSWVPIGAVQAYITRTRAQFR